MADTTCLDIVRAGDKDIFLTTLFAPVAAQPHLLALRAFAIEIERIPHLVSEPQIGEIRLQWWLDTLDSISQGEPQSHPVALALSNAIHQHGLPIAPLKTLVEAQRFGLYADRMPDMPAVEGYCGETQSALFQLSCIISQKDAAAHTAIVSGLAGVAFGLARSLTDSVVAEKIIPPETSREQLIRLTEQRLQEAKAALANLPLSVFPAFLPLAVVPLYLSAARAQKTTVPQWRRQWRIWRAARNEKL